MSAFADRLKKCRTANNRLQKDVSEVLKITTRNYQRYESGELEPNIENINKLADYFEVSTDYLLGRSDDPTRH